MAEAPYYYVDDFFKEPDRAMCAGVRTIIQEGQLNTDPRLEIRAEYPVPSLQGLGWKAVKDALREELDRIMREEGIRAKPVPRNLK
jgi:hypothetical protein